MSKLITFIGNGNMALSIAKGLRDNYKIEVVGRDLEKLKKFEVDLGITINKHLIDNFDITDKTIMLCVKPANIQSVGKKLTGKARVLYSVLAGIDIDTLRLNLSTNAVVRTMPNLAASVGHSHTTLTGDTEFKNEAKKLLGTIGSTTWLNSD